MANYNDLKTDIDAVIKTNGRQKISGAAFNAQLKNMIAELGTGYQYKGIATPATNPGTPDANVFYLASEAGTYTNFRGIVINEGEVCALVWNGTWTKQVTGAATAAQVSQLGQKVDESLGIAIDTQAGSIQFKVKAGEKYYIFNDGYTANVSTATGADVSTIVDGPFLTEPNVPLVFTATADANYLRFANQFKGGIIKESYLFTLLSLPDSYTETAFGKEINESSSASIPFPIKKGESYIVVSKVATSLAISTRETAAGSTIDGPVSLVGNTATLVASSDANYLRLSAAFSGYVFRMTALYNVIQSNSEKISELEKTITNIVGDDNENVKNFSIPANSDRSGIKPISLDGTYRIKITGVTPSSVVFYTSSYATTTFTENLNDFEANLSQIAFVNIIVNAPVASETAFVLSYRQVGVIEKLQDDIDSIKAETEKKVDIKVGKNLFDKDSTDLIDGYAYDSSGNLSGSPYWMVSNPIDVSEHQGGKIICNKSATTINRFSLFLDSAGNKTVIASTDGAYTIPSNAVTARILVYKQGGNVNLDEVQIEFGNASSEYEPYNPVGGYFSEEEKDETVFPPSPQKDMHDSYASINTAFIYGVFDSWVAKFPTYVVKTNLGRDASNTFDVNGYKISFAENPVYKIMFICNQHGGSANGDPVMGAYIATQFINDICGSGHRHNDRLKWIRNNVEIYIIPAANPWGIDNKRRVNYNGVNLNRNWPTSGWASEASGEGTDDYKGAAAGDQPEVQHYLQFISDTNPDIIIDNHTLGGYDGQADANSGIMFIGFNKDAIDNGSGYSSFIATINALMSKEYAIRPVAYGHVDSVTPDCRTWCAEHNIWGGLIEMQWRDPLDSEAGFTPNIIEASYMLCLSIYQYYATQLNP